MLLEVLDRLDQFIALFFHRVQAFGCCLADAAQRLRRIAALELDSIEGGTEQAHLVVVSRKSGVTHAVACDRVLEAVPIDVPVRTWREAGAPFGPSSSVSGSTDPASNSSDP